MSDAVCDRCGRHLPSGGTKYTALLEIVHDADPLEITEEDLDRDYAAEIGKLLRKMSRGDPKAMEEEVYCKRTAHLCGPCRRQVLRAFPARIRRKPRGGRRPRPRRPPRRS